jgi:hypothetical protein
MNLRPLTRSRTGRHMLEGLLRVAHLPDFDDQNDRRTNCFTSSESAIPIVPPLRRSRGRISRGPVAFPMTKMNGIFSLLRLPELLNPHKQRAR